MIKGAPAIVSVLVFVVLAFVALKVLGALIGFAIKAVLLVVAVGVAVVVYRSLQNKLGGPGAP
jgi:hypothetical protein